ncbi:MAG: polymerase subunit sigma-24, partial [Acidimicrobiia bacterium]|nr:polymerase subunit sigma-24 [Acidimicrobiia bacterium]
SDRQAAEDAVQETFLRAYRAMPRFDGDFHLQAWLHRICTNVCYDELDRRRRHGLVETRLNSEPLPDAPEADPDADAQTDAMRMRLADALQQIPGPYREALVLHYGEHLPFREIALRTGVSEANARARASRGRRALRKLMAAPVGVLVFLIPALRRGQRTAVAAEAALPLDHAANVANVATVSSPSSSFMSQVVPTVARVMNEAGPLISNKAQLLTGAVAAASTVAVPVAATQVLDHQSAKPAAAVAAAPSTTRVGNLASPTTTVITVAPPAGKLALVPAGTQATTTVPSGAGAAGVAGPSTTVDPSVLAQLPTTTTASGATTTSSPSSGSSTTRSGATTTGPASNTSVPSVASVSVAAAGKIGGVTTAAKGAMVLTGDITLDGIIVRQTSFSAVATTHVGAHADPTPDDILIVFTIDKAEFSVSGRGNLSADGSKFVFTEGFFSVARPGDLTALGLRKGGNAAGTIGLAPGSDIKLTLK